MIFQLQPNHVRAFGTPEEVQALYEELVYDLGEKRGKVQRLCLYNPILGTFPLGLWREAETALRSRGVSVIVNDLRRCPATRRGLPLAWLLPHQREAVEAAIRLSVTCIDIPTAGGKGEVLAALPMELPCDWLILADDAKVLSQLGDPKVGRFVKRSGERPGRIGGGLWEEGYRVTVASPATLDQRWDGNRWDEASQRLFQRVRGVIYDEVHMSGSPRSQRILASIPNAYYWVGFSGTIEGRGDRRDMTVRSFFGPAGYKVQASVLEAAGVIATQKLVMVRCDQPDQPAYEAGGYQRAVTLSKARNGVIARIWQKEKTGCLTFIRELDHGRYLLRIAQHLGIRAEFVNGEMDAGPIDKAITRFERGEIDVLIASDVLKQGADTIHVYSGINAAGRKSVIETIQRRGRAGRICREAGCARCAVMGKKSTATWYDLYDTDSLAEKMWSERRRKLPGLWLGRHSRERLAAYKAKGILVDVVSDL
jgi:superfamily II DNA or RNA helicase